MREDVQVLLSVDLARSEEPGKPIKRADKDFPISWVKAYGKGAVFKAPEVKKGTEDGTIAIASFEEIYKTAPETLLLVDVRDSGEFDKGSLKGAINIPINDLEKRMDELTRDKDRRVVFFCGAGGRSGEAYDMVKLFEPDLQTFFLNAEIEFNKDGSHAMKALE